MPVDCVEQCFSLLVSCCFFCVVEDATDVLLSLSPCGLKNLLYNLLSGREYRIDQFSECTHLVCDNGCVWYCLHSNTVLPHFAVYIPSLIKPHISLSLAGADMGEMEPQISIIAPTKRDMSKQLRNDVSVLGSIDEEPIEEKVGVWRRRRRLDGALNRIPAEFYTQVWYILERVRTVR